jgi:hypothetical protein
MVKGWAAMSEFIPLGAFVDLSCVLVTDGDEYVTM